MLRIKGLNKDFHGQTILNKVSFTLNPQEKIALVGSNGAGKSTLLKIIAGLEEADSGEIEKNTELKIAYLPQELKSNLGQTIADYVKSVVGIHELETIMNKLEQDLNDETKIAEYGNMQEQYERKRGYSFEARLNIMLQGFDLLELKPDRLLFSLSSGQKTKVALIGVLMQNADVLLLDEPTNNLDLSAIIWLEMFLQKTKASLIITSHDQRFLDRVASRVIAIDWYTRQIDMFSGTYSEYLEYMRQKIAKEKQAARLQQDKIKQILESSRQQKQWTQKGANQTTTDNDKYIRGFRRDRSAGMAKKARVAEDKVAKMEIIKITKERIPLSIPLNIAADEAKPAIRLSAVEAGYNGRKIIGPIDLQIEYGGRLGIIGSNGQGKTTLLKVITQDLKPIFGKVQLSPSLRLGNLMQEHENLNWQATILNFILAKTYLSREEIFRLLDVFNFSSKFADKLIGDLSPGERARLIFLIFAANSSNALILDEPSNYLDLEAIAALEEILQAYRGTVVLVSHDRYLLSRIKLTHLYLLAEGRLQLLPDLEQYLRGLQNKSQDLFDRIRVI